MLIISWNVAGLAPLTKRIHESYNPTSQKGNKRARPSVALQEFFSRHGADIYCLQEHKIPQSQLSSRSEPHGCSDVEGYESFWSCCVDTGRQGFNGVVTYAKKGTVLSADASPLRSKDLDDQGRCVMTDHGSFVLFNVYVPASGGTSLEDKMRFLIALRNAMKEQRKQKPVMLVGDLNIKYSALDRPWKDRVVHVNNLLAEVASCDNAADLPQWKRQLAEAWPLIVDVMDNKRVVATQTQNPTTGAKFEKFRLQITVNGSDVFLGRHEQSEGGCLYFYDFDAWQYECPESGETRLAREANVVCVFILAELMDKIAGVKWDEATQRVIANTGAGVRIEPPQQWLHSLFEDDGMVDTFRHFYPTAEGRFTCWSQYTNKRYENDGVRLDYMLVDSSLLEHVLKGDVPTLRCGGATDHDPLGEDAAFCAATANGAFQPVPYAGGGIVDVPQTALDTQFGAPHTGVIYTPPSFSDHVAVSLLMNEACCSRNLELNERDAATRNSRPHKKQRSMASFLSKPSASGSSKKSSSSTTHRFGSTAKKSKPKPKDMRHFFGSQGNGASKRPKLESNNNSQT